MISRARMVFVVGLALAVLAPAAAAVAGPDEICARIRDSDVVRPYDPNLRPGFVRAFHKLFPKARGGQSEAMLRAEGVYRCMGGRLYACFVGANLPCAKIDGSKANPGAEAFCRDNPKATDVPLVAVGHDTGFAWTCRGGHAVAGEPTWKLDRRGFASDLWAPLD